MHHFSNSQQRWTALALLLCCGVPISGYCCEPIFPLVQLLGGSSFAGPLLLTKSLACLAAAIIIKCVAFAFFERRLAWPAAVGLMLIANIASTVPGVLIAGFSGSLSGIILALPIVGILGMLVGRRQKLLLKPGQNPTISGGMAALAFTGFFIASVVLYGLANTALDSGGYAGYWAFKFAFVTLVACTGLVISAVVEELVIAQFTRKSNAHQSFYTSVFRSNYITLGVILLIAALEMLPKRLGQPGFLASWLNALSSLLGFA